MCFFSSCNCQNNVIVRRIVGPMGPMGPRGPIGPQGPVGPQGLPGTPATNDILYARSGENTVADGAIIPIALNGSTPTTTLSVANNSVVLPAGTYLVSYFSSGSVATGNFITDLYLNGGAIPNESLVQTNTANSISSASKTVLINAPTGGTLSLYNNSGSEATIEEASLTVSKVA